MMRISQGLGQTGQMPPGEVRWSSSSPIRNLSECNETGGQLFANNSACCNYLKGEGFDYWLCRQTTFGQQSPSSQTPPDQMPDWLKNFIPSQQSQQTTKSFEDTIKENIIPIVGVGLGLAALVLIVQAGRKS